MEKAASGVSRLQPLVSFTVFLIVANQVVMMCSFGVGIFSSFNAGFVGFAQAGGLDKILGIGG